MAVYAQIAQKSWTVNREDGTTREIRITIEEQNGAPANLEIPLVQDIVITAGDRSDEINKPIKVHQLALQLKKTAAAGDLLSKIDGAGYRQLRITVTDLTANYELFKGYIIGDQSEFNLYEKVQSLRVKATGQLADLVQTEVANENKTLSQLAAEITTSLDIDRELDVYSDLRHDGKATSDPLPNELRANLFKAAGSVDKANLFQALQGILLPLGWQVLQENGRLAFADIFHRFSSSLAINKLASNGAGGYTRTIENHKISLTKADIIRGGKFRDLPPVLDFTHNHILNTRDNCQFPDTNNQRGNFTKIQSQGLVRAGDSISVRHFGEFHITDVIESTEGELQYGQVRIVHSNTGEIYYYDFTAEEWTTVEKWRNVHLVYPQSHPDAPTEFFGSFGVNAYTKLAPVPEGVIGSVEVECGESASFSEGGGTIQYVEHTMTVGFEQVDSDEAIRHSWSATGSVPVGKNLISNTFIGDADAFTSQQSFQYWNGSMWQNTNAWVDGEETTNLGDLVRGRVGKLLIGSRKEFEFNIRDLNRVSLLSVFEFTNNDDVLVTGLPVEIVHHVLKGYYSIKVIGVFNDIASSEEFYSFETASSVGTSAGTGSGSSGGGSSSGGGGGVSDHGLLSGLNDPSDHPWALQVDFSNVADQGQAQTALGLVPGTNVQAYSPRLATLANLSANQADGIVGVGESKWPLVAEMQDVKAAAKPTFAGINLTSAIEYSGSNVIEFEPGKVVFPGNVEFLGDVFSAQVTNLDVEDPLILLGDGNATNALDIGIIGKRSASNVGVIWDESADEWAFILTEDDGTTAGNVTISSYANIRAHNMAVNGAFSVSGISTFYDNIQSDDYVLNTSGWRISAGGHGYFTGSLVSPSIPTQAIFSTATGTLTIQNDEEDTLFTVNGITTTWQYLIDGGPETNIGQSNSLEFKAGNGIAISDVLGVGDHTIQISLQSGIATEGYVDFAINNHAHSASDITSGTLSYNRLPFASTDVTNWNTAFGWGDHAGLYPTVATFNSHANSTSNPHSVTKSQVGLGSVQNYGIATDLEAEAGTVNTKYMTPLRVAQAIDVQARSSTWYPTPAEIGAAPASHTHSAGDIVSGTLDYNRLPFASTDVTNWNTAFGWGDHSGLYPTVATFNAHANSTSNPHSVTKSQVGLGSVQNYGIATQLEAQNGTVTNKYMTPLRVAEAIDVQARSSTWYPTPAEIGAAPASHTHAAADIVSGTLSYNRLPFASSDVTNWNTAFGWGDHSGLYPTTASFSGHTGNTSNPHSVTKSQVGLGSVENYAIANQLEAEGGVVTNKYMTPIRVAQAIDIQARAADWLPTPAEIGAAPASHTHSAGDIVSGTLDYNRLPFASSDVSNWNTAFGWGDHAGLYPTVATFNSHANSTSNPHSVTKSQVGLGSVQNYGIATDLEAEAGTVNTKYMTPLRVAQAIEIQARAADWLPTPAEIGAAPTSHTHSAGDIVSGTLSYNRLPFASTDVTNWNTAFGWGDHAGLYTPIAHASNTSNPHSVTKSQVGLGSVQNYGIADQLEAEGGTVTNKYMTPIRVAQAIDVQARSSTWYPTPAEIGAAPASHTHSAGDIVSGTLDYNRLPFASTDVTNWNTAFGWGDHSGLYPTVVTFNAHANSTSNPHSVTKSQVGLGNVQNYGIATQAEAEAGTVNNKYMTPLRVAQAIDQQARASDWLPTPAQIGAEPSFSKNSAFNKSFGLNAGQVAEGNHTHAFSSITGTVSTSQLPTIPHTKTDFANQNLNTGSSPTFAGGTITGDFRLNAASPVRLYFGGSAQSSQQGWIEGDHRDTESIAGGSHYVFKFGTDQPALDVIINGQLYINTNEVWHAGNLTGNAQLTNTAGYVTVNNYVDGLTFATSTGILSLNRNGLTTLTVDLDGRYALTGDVPTNNNQLINGAGYYSSGSNVSFGTGSFSGNVTISSDLWVVSSGDNGLRVRADIGDAYGFSDTSGNAVVLLNEQGTTCQAIYLGDTSTSGSDTLFGVSRATSTSNPTTGSEAGWASVFDLRGNGNSYQTGVNYASDHADTSDRRIKSNLQSIDALEIAEYANLYKYQKEGIEGIQYGLIAQDMMRYNPDIVGRMSHDKLGEIYTLSGYSIGSIALAGVKELNIKIDSEVDRLSRRISELEAEVQRLKGEA